MNIPKKKIPRKFSIFLRVKLLTLFLFAPTLFIYVVALYANPVTR